MNVYLATSWKNREQVAKMKEWLLKAGHDVYDFTDPANAFDWKKDLNVPELVTATEFRDVLNRPVAQQSFEKDTRALKQCDALVLMLPCGASAHIEAGFAAGQGKPVVITAPQSTKKREGVHEYRMPGQFQPELMYGLSAGVIEFTKDAILKALAELK